MTWLCDSSALVKRYVQEIGSRWFRREVDRHTMVIAQITVVEVHAALALRYRTGTISVITKSLPSHSPTVPLCLRGRLRHGIRNLVPHFVKNVS
jgi:hypothetical protein